MSQKKESKPKQPQRNPTLGEFVRSLVLLAVLIGGLLALMHIQPY